MSDIPSCPISQVMKTGLIHNSLCARIKGVNACCYRGKATVLLPERVSERCWLSYLLIEDKVNQIV